MNIGGRNTIACTKGHDEFPGAVTISPLPHQPVVKDLVPDLTTFYAQHTYVQPYLKTTTPEPQKEWRQSREALYRTILDLQNPTGYWNPEDGTERQAGRVYSTSLSVLALAIEYGFLPIYQR